MQSAVLTPEEYIAEVPEERRAVFMKLRNEIKKNLPKGFQEKMGYGMIGYVVPHKLYPAGYHCDPKLPLPFMGLASQKNFIAVYHMGIYAKPSLLNWFTEEFAKQSPAKLDMGKSCIRFKKPENTTIKLMGELATKMTVDEWIDCYESAFKKNNK